MSFKQLASYALIALISWSVKIFWNIFFDKESNVVSVLDGKIFYIAECIKAKVKLHEIFIWRDDPLKLKCDVFLRA